MQAYLYDGYWEDIGTIKAFYDANLALTDENPNFRCAHHCVTTLFSSTLYENGKLLQTCVHCFQLRRCRAGRCDA